jgi:hypothetical protein
MFEKVKSLQTKASALVGIGIALVTVWLTYASGWLVTFDATDNAMADQSIWNGLTNLWAWVKFVAPYVGTFLGIWPVVWLIMYAVSRRKAAAH